MRKFLFGVVFLFNITVCFSQESDSEYYYFIKKNPSETLEFPYDLSKDTLKVINYCRGALKLLAYGKYKEAFSDAEKGLAVAYKIGYKRGIAECNQVKATIRHQQGSLAKEVHKNSLYAQSLDYYLESLKVYEKLNDLRRTSDISFQIGILYKEWGAFHMKALSYFKIAYNLKSKVKDVNGEISSLTELGNSYIALKQYENAIIYLKKLLAKFLGLERDRDALDTSRKISESYQQLKKFNEALKYEKQVLTLKKGLRDSTGVVNSYNNLGYLYKYLGRYNDALNYFDKSLTLSKKYNPTGQPTLIEKTILMNKGIIYHDLKDYKNSNKSFYDALSIWVAKGKPEEIANIYKKIATNQAAMNDYEGASNSLRQAISTTSNSDDKQFVASSYKDLSEIYQKLGDDKNALKCYQLYANANDIYLMEQNKKQEDLLQQQYKINIAETARKLAIAEKEIKEIELDKKKNENDLLRRDRELYKRNEELQNIRLDNEQTEKIKARQELIILEQQYEIAKKDNENKILQQRDSIRDLELLKIELEEKQKAQEFALLKEQATNQTLKLDEQRSRERFFYGIFIALAIIVFLVLRGYINKRKAHKKLSHQNLEIQLQKDKLEQAYHNVKQLSEIGKNITSNLSIERIIETVYLNLNPLMDATVFGVGLYNEKENSLEFPGLKERGETIIMISRKLSDKNQLSVQCFQKKETIFIGDFQNEYKDYIDEVPDPVTGQHASSIIYLPLLIKEKAIGVITVQSFRKNAYTEYHLNILRNLAVHTAIALENASIYGQIKDKTTMLENTLKDLKAAQAQLVQSEKMASLGQLTAGIAHEINNPINFVYAGIDGLKDSLETVMEVLGRYEKIEDIDNVQNIRALMNEIKYLKDELYYDETKGSIKDLIGAIKEGAHRTAEIVEGLRNFSRTNETELKKVNIHKGIESSLVLLNNKINKQYIVIEKKFDPDLPQINCYPGQLNQVFMNLLSNAIEAIENKGKVEIITKDHTEFITVMIRDTGIGVNQQIVDKIFDPFFTTKDLGEGTGLGLSISFGIIKKHQGKLEVKSDPGKGSTFTIRIPKNLEKRKTPQVLAKVEA